MLMLHKPKCESYEITTIRTSSESHLHWKDHFHKNPIYFRIIAHFEADNEIDTSGIGKKNSYLNKTQHLMVIIYYLNWKMF